MFDMLLLARPHFKALLQKVAVGTLEYVQVPATPDDAAVKGTFHAGLLGKHCPAGELVPLPLAVKSEGSATANP